MKKMLLSWAPALFASIFKRGLEATCPRQSVLGSDLFRVLEGCVLDSTSGSVSKPSFLVLSFAQ